MATSTRKEKDHERYLRDRERRLELARIWREAHPNYHNEWYHKKRQEYLQSKWS